MTLEDYIPKPVDPNAPKVLDLSLCRQLISRAPKYLMQPGGDTIREFAEQLQLAMAELGGTSTKIVTAQNEAMRYQRESDTANNEVREAHQALLKAREELAAVKAELESFKPKEAPPPMTAPKKRGPKSKIVQMQPPAEKVAK